jgi:septal ring factor EnvC (AmiA/AmiB activator)
MKVCLPTIVLLSSLASFAFSCGSAHAANPVNSSIELQTQTGRATQRSQQRVDKLSDRTRELLQEYRQAHQELDSLRAYNDHLQRMVSTQQQTLASLETQLDEVQVTQREIVPLLGRMVETLARFVELDRPFLLQERRQRVEQLRTLLDRPDASVAEKYRRVMEAYQVETDYGRSIEAYRGTLERDGARRMVDFLRIGRTALLYQSVDGEVFGMWNQQERDWAPLPDRYRNQIRTGIKIARKQVAPNLLLLPIAAPEAAE